MKDAKTRRKEVKEKLESSQATFSFQGETYEKEFDEKRLSRQLRAVWRVMKDQGWHTFREIHKVIGMGSENGISARIRDFRKPQFGSFTVNRKRSGDPTDGKFEYQLIIPADLVIIDDPQKSEANNAG